MKKHALPSLLFIFLHINCFAINTNIKEPPKYLYKENYARSLSNENLLKEILNGIKNPRNIISINELGKRMLRTMHLDQKSFERDYNKQYLEEERFKQEYERSNPKKKEHRKIEKDDYFYP